MAITSLIIGPLLKTMSCFKFLYFLVYKDPLKSNCFYMKL